MIPSALTKKESLINPKKSTIEDGLKLCAILHEALLPVGLFPALTGGVLYKNGPRKDLDIVLYRHRQDREHFEVSDQDIVSALSGCGVDVVECYGFVTKTAWNGFSVDIFNPETKIVFELNYGDE